MHRQTLRTCADKESKFLPKFAAPDQNMRIKICGDINKNPGLGQWTAAAADAAAWQRRFPQCTKRFEDRWLRPHPESVQHPASWRAVGGCIFLGPKGRIRTFPHSPLRWAAPPASLPQARMSFWEGAELDSIDRRSIPTTLQVNVPASKVRMTSDAGGIALVESTLSR